MKLVLAIVSKDDSSMVSSALTQEGFPVTKLATTGGFLMAGNTTFISGVEDGQVDQVIDIIRKQSSRRTQIVPSASTMDGGMYTSVPIEVTVGGATIFVLDVDRFEKYEFRRVRCSETVKQSLSLAFQEARLPHAILLEGPAGSGKSELARWIAKAAVCTGEGERPCGHCPGCIKAAAGAHPDITIVGGGHGGALLPCGYHPADPGGCLHQAE